MIDYNIIKLYEQYKGDTSTLAFFAVRLKVVSISTNRPSSFHIGVTCMRVLCLKMNLSGRCKGCKGKCRNHSDGFAVRTEDMTSCCWLLLQLHVELRALWCSWHCISKLVSLSVLPHFGIQCYEEIVFVPSFLECILTGYFTCWTKSDSKFIYFPYSTDAHSSCKIMVGPSLVHKLLCPEHWWKIWCQVDIGQ